MNGIIIQKGTPTLRDKLTVSKKVRSIKAPASEIEPYFNAKKGLPSLRQHISSDDFGKHYNRCVRSHKLVFEAMQRLRLLTFYESLQESESENLDVIDDKLLAHFYENIAQLISVDQDFTSWKTSYECFIQKRSEENPTFAFWSTYIEMVQLLLLFIRATRTSDWNLHLSTLR